MEIGAVMGAAPRRAVQRLTSDPGDIIVLLGGRTGRMDVVEQQVLQRFIQKNLLKHWC